LENERPWEYKFHCGLSISTGIAEEECATEKAVALSRVHILHDESHENRDYWLIIAHTEVEDYIEGSNLESGTISLYCDCENGEEIQQSYSYSRKLEPWPA